MHAVAEAIRHVLWILRRMICSVPHEHDHQTRAIKIHVQYLANKRPPNILWGKQFPTNASTVPTGAITRAAHSADFDSVTAACPNRTGAAAREERRCRGSVAAPVL